MRHLLIRWIIVAIALIVTVYVVPIQGIYVTGNGLIAVLGMAVILGFINAILRPVLAILSCGFILLTLGLFMLVINAFTLWLSAQIAVNWFGLGFYVRGFWPAFWGALVVSIVSFFLSMFFKGGRN
jgi:putative membrane protein